MSFRFPCNVARDVEYIPTVDEIFPQPTALDSIRFDEVAVGNDSVLVRHSDVSYLLNEVRLSKDLHESAIRDLVDKLKNSSAFDTSRLSDSQLHSLVLKRSMQSFNDYQNVSDRLEDLYDELVSSIKSRFKASKPKPTEPKPTEPKL